MRVSPGTSQTWTQQNDNACRYIALTVNEFLAERLNAYSFTVIQPEQPYDLFLCIKVENIQVIMSKFYKFLTKCFLQNQFSLVLGQTLYNKQYNNSMKNSANHDSTNKYK